MHTDKYIIDKIRICGYTLRAVSFPSPSAGTVALPPGGLVKFPLPARSAMVRASLRMR